MNARSIHDRLQTYEGTARLWSTQANSPARNAVFRKNHAAFKAIRSTYQGQDAIRRLATDSNDALSGLAATHALWFDREFGSQILGRLAGM
jgi:hypothetical protein